MKPSASTLNKKDADIAYSRKRIKAGYPSGELRTELLRKGYTLAEVDQLILAASKSSKGSKDKEVKISVIAMTGVSLLITGIALGSVQNYYTTLARFVILCGLALLIPSVIKFFSKQFIRKEE